MDGKVTYLLGAGASAQCIPTVEKTLMEMNNFKSKIESAIINGIPLDIGGIEMIKSKQKNNLFLNHLTNLIEESKNEMTIDTYAKLLYEQRETEKLKQLKSVLSFFYIFKQLGRTDKRYRHFFLQNIDSTVSNLDKNTISNRIRVLSWNYDYQIEKSLAEIKKIYDLKIIQEIVNIAPSPNREFPINQNEDNFEVVKLNGTTAFKDNRENEIINLNDNLNNNVNEIDLIKRITNLYNTRRELFPTLSFAWEADSHSPVLSSAINISKITSILVVIGYSFPQFNRKIDEMIISNMKHLKKVYIQSNHPENIERKLSSILSSINVELINKVDEFYIPDRYKI